MMPVLNLLLLFVLAPGCLDAKATAVQPEVRRVTYERRFIEAEVSIPKTAVEHLARQLGVVGVTLTAVWTNPAGAGSLLAIIIGGQENEHEYGPQLVLLDIVSGSPKVVHASPRLFDVDFINPNFFELPPHVLLIADYGCEDAYGVIIWSLGNGTVRELGELPIALPEDGDVFTRGAGGFATVFRIAGRHVIEIPGPLLLNPRGRDETLQVGIGEIARFCETGRGFERCP